MINRLIILMTVCLMSFSAMANASSSETKEGDNLPPLVIETDNVKYAGIKLKLDKNPTITARQETAIHKEPSPNSPVIGTMQRNDKVSIIGAKAYIYPRMGKTKIIKDMTLVDEFGNKKILKPGDVMYLISHNIYGENTIWYKDTFFMPTETHNIKMPAPYSDSDGEGKYAEYEGYTNKQDTEADFELYIEYPNDNPHTPMNTWTLVDGTEFRRNADIWLYVELPDKVTRGWVQYLNAHLGSMTYKQIWWRQPSVDDRESFNLSFTYKYWIMED